MSRIKTYDEDFILMHTPVSKQQLANMKAHLYRQILTSLRMQSTEHDCELQLGEQCDFAKLLYKRGLYRQSLKSLERAKALARNYHADNLLASMISFERMIESQHITRSYYPRAEELIQEAEEVLEKVHRCEVFSNLSLRFYGMHIRTGSIRNEYAKPFVEEYLHANCPDLDANAGFLEKLMFYQMQLWRYFILQNLTMCYRYSLSWIRLFKIHPQMKQSLSMLYLKGFHYLLEALFYFNDYHRFIRGLKSFEYAVETIKRPDKNTRIQSFVYLYSHRLNQHFMEGSFSEGIEQLLPELTLALNKYSNYLDAHQLMVFDYKIACLYFGNGHFISAINHLERIINRYEEGLREDLQAFSRLLHLLACYEAECFDKLEKQIKIVYKFFLQLNQRGKVQHAILKFLKELGDIYPDQLKSRFIKLKNELSEYFEDRYEKKSLLYLDIISWLESKIENKPVKDIIRIKFLKKTNQTPLAKHFHSSRP
ncbi:hypothetical protein [Bacteroidetes bacterium endosymbiont of Geopemphigus sp.]|uniref:hypothetical protein n=1 Tax=Bacteroidetes bacterium endosymbiont of Geopemphigus sp. TaxID=2047937 RepID=UPI001F4DED5B|nr:hypothetical protein [Bacteroidetes bacterium endosymbiont of Geopemphigus sp.]